MQFDGPTLGQLREALEDAFDPFTLPIMLKERLNRSWYRYVPAVASFDVQISSLLQRANAENWTEQIPLKAREFNPGNPKLAAFAADIGLGPRTVNFEKTVQNANAFLDINLFREKLGKVEFQVCRIEIKNDNDSTSYGTGFLVGPSAVLTNFHVIEAVVAGTNGKMTPEGLSAKASNVRCRFDYKELRGETINPGTVYQLAEDWKFDLSEPDPPGPSKLDYALLRLERPAADEPIAALPGSAGDKRGFLKLPSSAYPFPAGTPLFVVQHPSHSTMKIAFETNSVVSVSDDRSRVEHKTNTEPGSSGSPCFTQRLDPVALHHGESLNPDGNNIGIPLDSVRSLIETHGAGGALG